MAVSVTHRKVSSGTVNTAVEVDLSNWNDTHVVTGLSASATTDATDSANVNFTQTGGSARSVSDRLKDTVDLKDYGAKGDVVNVTLTCSITSGAKALIAVGGTFALTDVGKVIAVPGAGSAGGVLASKIDAFTDATHVTLHDNAGTTLTAASTAVMYGTDDQPAIQAAIDALPNGGKLVGPVGKYLLNTVRNNAMLDLSGNRTFCLEGMDWSFKNSGAFIPLGTVFMGGPNIPNTASFIRLNGTDKISAPVFRNFAYTCYDGAFGTPVGLHGIYFDAVAVDAYQIFGAIVENLFIDNMSAGFSIKGKANATSASGIIPYSRIRNNFIRNIDAEYFGDGVVIAENTIDNGTAGTRDIGIRYNLLGGATSITIEKNVIGTANGGIIDDGSAGANLFANELEQSVGTTNSAGAQVYLRGTVSPVNGATLIGNNYSQNSAAVPIPLKLGSAFGTVTLGGRYSVPSGNHIQVTASATNTYIGPAYSTVASVLGSLGVSDSGNFTRQDAVDFINLPGDTSGKIRLYASAVSSGGVIFIADTATSDTLVARNTPDTLANKTLTHAVVGTEAVGDNTTLAASTAFVQANAGAHARGFVNKFRNATMGVWQRGTSALAAAATTVNAYTADGWIINATYSAGAGPVMSQVANSRTGARSLWALKILGAANVTDVKVGQRIEGADAAPFGNGAVTIQAQISNSTGGSVTPTLTVKYPTATDNYASTTTDAVASAVSLQACPDATVTRVAYTFTPSGNPALGMEIMIDLGALVATKFFSISEPDIRATPGLAAGLNSSPPIPEMRPIHTELTQCQRYLVGYNAGVATTFYFAFGGAFSTTQAFCTFALPNMRISPTGLTVSSAGHFVATDGSATQKTLTALTMGVVSPVAAVLLGTVASGLTLGQTSAFGSQSASAQLLFTGAEL